MLEIQSVPIDSIKPNPENPRLIRDQKFKSLVKSLQECPSLFDARPCICSDRTGELIILGGNMRWRAAKELKWQMVPVIVMSGLDELQEKEITIKDNGDWGEWDFELLSAWDDLPLVDWGVLLPKEWSGNVEGTDLPVLPDGDRPSFRQMTFTLHDTQAEQVETALKVSKGMGQFTDSENENSNGNALARICETFLTEHGQS